MLVFKQTPALPPSAAPLFPANMPEMAPSYRAPKDCSPKVTICDSCVKRVFRRPAVALGSVI